MSKHFYIPDADTCKVLTHHFTEISKNITKQYAKIGIMSDFVAKFEEAIQLNKAKLLSKFGKQGRKQCDHCGKPSKARCAGCHVTRYCSDACNVAGWKQHKETCKEISKRSLLLDKIV